MKRSEFIQYLSLASISLKLFPYVFNFRKMEHQISLEQLMGIAHEHLLAYENTSLEKDTLEAYMRMKAEASKEGIQLHIVSGFRSFQRQKEIFESKFNRLKNEGNTRLEAYQNITRYSSIPGTSRHHWGTDIDLIDTSANLPKGDLLIEENYEEGGAFSKLFNWMSKNANRFGFYLTYPPTLNRSGFAFEPWHFSYQPTSRNYLKQLDPQGLEKKLRLEKIEGLEDLSANYIPTYLQNYLYGINPELLP